MNTQDKTTNYKTYEEELLSLRNTIETLPKETHLEIFKILRINDVEFSENKNGIFVNLSFVMPNVINKIKKYLTYVSKQENMINEIETQKHTVEEQYFT